MAPKIPQRTNVSLLPETGANASPVNTSTQEFFSPTVSTPELPTNEIAALMELIKQQGETMKIMQEQILEQGKSEDSLGTKSGRERYTGDPKFAYSMYDGKPIVSMKTISLKNRRNELGMFSFVQTMRFTFSDNTTLEGEYEDLMRNVKKSSEEGEFAREVKNMVYEGKLQKHYKFLRDGIEFFIPLDHIN